MLSNQDIVAVKASVVCAEQVNVVDVEEGSNVTSLDGNSVNPEKELCFILLQNEPGAL